MDADAADVMFHWSCYKEFTDSCVLKKLEDKAEQRGIHTPKPMLDYFLRWNYQCLLAKIEYMLRLCGRFFALLADMGINNEEYQRENFERHLWNSLEIQALNRSLPVWFMQPTSHCQGSSADERSSERG